MQGLAIKKPVEINWFEWNNDLEKLKTWIKLLGQKFEDHFLYDEFGLRVKTLEGTSYAVEVGYIIIRGVQFEYYPCEPKIFEETYTKSSITI